VSFAVASKPVQKYLMSPDAPEVVSSVLRDLRSLYSEVPLFLTKLQQFNHQQKQTSSEKQKQLPPASTKHLADKTADITNDNIAGQPELPTENSSSPVKTNQEGADSQNPDVLQQKNKEEKERKRTLLVASLSLVRSHLKTLFGESQKKD